MGGGVWGEGLGGGARENRGGEVWWGVYLLMEYVIGLCLFWYSYRYECGYEFIIFDYIAFSQL